MRVQVGILRTLRLSRHKRYAQISITSQLYHKILWLSRKGQLTATWKSIPSGDIHTPEAVQKTAATGAGSRHAPTGLLQLLFFLFCVDHDKYLLYVFDPPQIIAYKIFFLSCAEKVEAAPIF